MTGFLGGLTTFSTFSAEVVTSLMEARMNWAFRDGRQRTCSEHRDDSSGYRHRVVASDHSIFELP